MLVIILLGLFGIKFGAAFNDFPSLMIANATLAVVIERPFFERKAVRRRHTTRNAYEKKLETFLKSITEAAKSPSMGSNSGIEISLFQNTNVNLARDYTALLSVASCEQTWNLFEQARKEKVVHLAITDNNCPRLPIAHGISIPIVEPGKELAQMLLDFRVERVLTWSKINLIHDRVFERDMIGSVLKALSNEIPNLPHIGLSSQCFFSTDVSNRSSTRMRILDTLSNFLPRQRADERFLLVVTHEIVPVIIESARSLGLLHPESQWLFVLPDSAEDPSNVTSFGKLLAEGENIAFIYNVTDSDEDCRIGKTLEVGLRCHAKGMIRSLASAVENALKQEIGLYETITEEEFDAVRMTKAERCQQIVTFIREDLYNAGAINSRTKICDGCMMWEMLTGITWGNSFDVKNKTEPHALIDVGHWTPGQGSLSKDLLFPHEKYGFKGKTLPVVTYHNPPWQYVTKSEETGEFKWDGLVLDIVKELSKKLNFTYEFVAFRTTAEHRGPNSARPEVPSNRSKSRLKEEEVIRALTSSGKKIPDEVIEFVRSERVFMAACASTIVDHLKSSVNFTHPISVQTYGLLTTRPKPLSRAMLFASPYTSESWACLAAAILLTGPVLYLVHRYSPSPSNDLSGHLYVGLSSPARCLWYIYGALLQQGGMHLPKNDGARLIVGTWWLVVMIIVATYSGSLVAFLTFPRMDETISSIADLLKHKDTLTWSLPAKSFLVEYLTRGKNGPYDGLLADDEGGSERHDSNNYMMIIDRVKAGTHVLVDWMSSLRVLAKMDNPLTEDDKCHFSIGTEAFVEEPIALILPLNSPYLSLINTQLKRMNEAGLIEKWTKDRMPMKDECWEGSSMNNRANNHKVDVWDMQGIFFVLFLGKDTEVAHHTVIASAVIGYLVASVYLGWEFLSHYRKLARERKVIRPFRS